MGRLSSLIFVLVTGVTLQPVPAAGEEPVAMSGSRYVPRDVVVSVGETVVWTNQDAAGHSVTADDASFDSNPTCGTLGGSCMGRGESFSHTFSSPGTVSYHCRAHGAPGGRGMAGTVTVRG